MPYSAAHKAKTRTRIVESARILFNRHGFDTVTIEMVMEHAGLTRGGFYNHFSSKEVLYAEAVSAFLSGRGAEWYAEAGVDPTAVTGETAQKLVDGYLSSEHRNDLDGQCPMIALPSDVARAGHDVKVAYHSLLESMVNVLDESLSKKGDRGREQALSLATLCVGGMVLSRAMPRSDLAEELRRAAHTAASQIIAK